MAQHGMAMAQHGMAMAQLPSHGATSLPAQRRCRRTKRRNELFLLGESRTLQFPGSSLALQRHPGTSKPPPPPPCSALAALRPSSPCQGPPALSPAPTQPPCQLINAVSITAEITAPENTASCKGVCVHMCVHMCVHTRGLLCTHGHSLGRRVSVPLHPPRHNPPGSQDHVLPPHRSHISPSPSGVPGALPPPFPKLAGWQQRRAVINGAALPISG